MSKFEKILIASVSVQTYDGENVVDIKPGTEFVCNDPKQFEYLVSKGFAVVKTEAQKAEPVVLAETKTAKADTTK